MPRITRVHFVCRDNLNITERPNGLFVSGYWKLSADVALSVETIFLHESKEVESYRQGKVVDRHLVPYENGMRYIFVCEPTDQPRGWEGSGMGEKGYAH